MRIFGKLLGATLLAMMITLVVGVLGWFGLHTTRSALNTVIGVRTPQIQDIGRMVEILNQIRIDEVALVNPRLAPARRSQTVTELGKAMKELAATRQQFAALPMTPKQAELWARAQKALELWRPKHKRMVDLVADNRIVNVEILPGVMSQYLSHYRQWFDDLQHAVQNKVPFPGDLNPLESGFGHWLASYHSSTTSAMTEDPILNDQLTALQQSHEALYDMANKVDDLLAKGRFGKARAMLASEGQPSMEAFRNAMDAVRNYAADRVTQFDLAADYAFGDVAKAFGASVGSLRDLSAAVASQAVSDGAQANDISMHSQLIALAATGAGLLLALGFGLLLAHHMVRRLQRAMGMLKELEQGHLDVRLELAGRDEISEISRAMDAFAEDLQRRVLGVNTAACQMMTVSEHITTVAYQVSDAAHSQAKEVETAGAAVREIGLSVEQVGQGVAVLSTASASSTSSALEMSANSEELAGSSESLAKIAEQVGSAIAEMATSIQQVADNTAVLKESSDATVASVSQMDGSLERVERAIRDTAGVTEKVRRDVESGRVSVEATIDGINEIRHASQVTTEATASLSSKVRNIGKILGVIDDITDQTGLLALNASILAAQAGKHGAGFAVVAEEIRELSERTSRSTREIDEMIDEVQRETERVVKAIDSTERRVVEGEKLSLASGEVLAKIVVGIQEVDQRMEQIALATDEQSQEAGVIGKAMERVSQMVDQTATATREQSNTTRTIHGAVEQVRNLTLQVQSSAREQSHGSKIIAGDMEEINDMIQKINRACNEQTRERERIREAVAAIQRGAEVSLESTTVLQQVVASQNREIGVLREQMSAFRVESADCLSEMPSAPESNRPERSFLPHAPSAHKALQLVERDADASRRSVAEKTVGRGDREGGRHP